MGEFFRAIRQELTQVGYRRTPAKRLPKMPPRFRVRTLGKRSRGLAGSRQRVLRLGLRGSIDGQPLKEIRAGVTFSFGIFAARR